jgi:hypothetical protein
MALAMLCLFMASVGAAKAISDGSKGEIGWAKVGWGLSVFHLICALALSAIYH